MSIRFGSVCSGIEAASVAWNPLGWEAACDVERSRLIEKSVKGWDYFL